MSPITMSSLRNFTALIKATKAAESKLDSHEQCCEELTVSASNGLPSPELQTKISAHLAAMDMKNATKQQKIKFLEQAYSAVDVVQPFGNPPVNISDTLKAIQQQLADLDSGHSSNGSLFAATD